MLNPGEARDKVNDFSLTVLSTACTLMVVAGLIVAVVLGVGVRGHAGAALAFLSPVFDWFAVAVTGSDTSANALCGALQLTAASSSGCFETIRTD